MGRKRITQEQFENKVREDSKGEYELIGKYVNSKALIDIVHHKCEKTFKSSWDRWKAGNRCPFCANTAKKTHNEVVKKINETKDFKYISGIYENNISPIVVQCKKCNKNFHTHYARLFNQKAGCPYCANKNKRIIIKPEEYKELVYKITNGEYSVLEDAHYKTEKVLTRHNECGHEWKIDPFHFIDEGNRCTICNKIAKNESKPIKIIKSYLDKENIEYDTEKPITINEATNCWLKTDIYIKSMNLYIEYDGKQHFMEFYGDSEKLKKQKERDKIKNIWYTTNNIDFIRIPYTIYKEKDIVKLLDDKIKRQSAANPYYTDNIYKDMRNMAGSTTIETTDDNSGRE